MSPNRRVILEFAGVAGASFVLFAGLTVAVERLVLPGLAETGAVALYRLVYFAYMPLRQIFVSFEPSPTSYVAAAPALLASALMAFAAAACAAYMRHGRKRFVKVPPADAIPRRVMLERCVKGAVLFSGASGAAYATTIEPGRIAVRRYSIPIADLPPALEGLRIAHVSDTHYGPFIPLSFIERAIRRANDLAPDLIVLTGDYVHRTPRAIPEGIGILKGLEARFGILAVLGNHDHWEGADAVRARFAEIGLPLIDNGRRFLTGQGLSADPAKDALCIGGVGDLWEDATSAAAALDGVPPETPRLLLSHNPDYAEETPAGLRIDLMLSGHTHGGQVRLPALGTPIVPSAFGSKYAGGLCAGPRCPVLVSRGVGMAVLPVRCAVPPEIGLVTLHTKA